MLGIWQSTPTKGIELKNSQHLGIWFAIAILGFFLSPLVRSGQSMEQFIAYEVAQTREAMGDAAGDMVVKFANTLFKETVLSAGANMVGQAALTQKELLLSSKVAGPGGAMMASFFNSYIQGLVLQTYIVAIRLAIVLFWLFFVLPLLAASVLDGFMQRKVKQAEFGAIRPATFTLAGMVVIPLLVTPVLYLVLPFSITPMLAPMWAAIVVLPLSLLVSNSQPLFGR